ncbi:hypothetical protein [Actinomadura sp. GTD37]|uniref:hypothetical protein n=1 Tax=Actinomadura sp. GTD37 TaxID=1778030 RepID=UPI0035C1AAAB
MGVENKGGTDTRTETTDDSATRDRSPGPPPDNPGSPGQPSRLESRDRARQPQEQNGSQPAEDTGGGRTGEPRNGKPGRPQGGAEKAETPGRSETGQGGRRDEEPRSRDGGAQGGGSASSGRDRLQGQVGEQETDARTEPADKPAASPRQYTLPADNPGSPGQPSRLDSLARARQAQEQGRAQDVQDTGGGPAVDDRETRSVPAQAEGGGQASEATGKTDAGTGRDAPEPGKDQRGPTSGEETLPPDTGTAAGGASGEGGRPASEISGGEADGRASEATRPQDQEQQPLPRQDAAAPSEDRTPQGTEQNPQGTDSPGERPPGPAGRPGEQATGPQEPGTDAAPGRPEPQGRDAGPAGDSETGSQAPDGPADEGPAAPPGTADTGAGKPADQAEARPGGDSPSEETGETSGKQEPHGEPNGDRGRKAEDNGTEQNPNETNETNPETRANPILSDVYRDSQGQVRVEPRYGREHPGEPGTELARSEPEATEPAELPDRGDLDPVGEQDTEAGRGELRDPENDPLDRNPGDPERPTRRKELLKEAMKESENIVDTTDKAVEGAFKALDQKPPTGHPSTARDTSAHMDPVQTPIKAGSATYALLGTAILATQATRWSIEKIREVKGR